MNEKRATYDKLRKQLLKLLEEVKQMNIGMRERVGSATLANSWDAIRRSAPGFGTNYEDDLIEATADVGVIIGEMLAENKIDASELGRAGLSDWIIKNAKAFSDMYLKVDWGQMEESYIDLLGEFVMEKLERSGLLKAETDGIVSREA